MSEQGANRGRPAGFSSGKAAALVIALLAACAQIGVACNGQVTVSTGGSGGSSTAGSTSGGSVSPTGGASSGGAVPGGSTSMGGLGGQGGSWGDGGTGPDCLGYGDVCTECLSWSCSSSWCACDSEPHCLGYLQCLGTCAQGDTACYQSCASVHEPGISLGFLLASCAATACAGDCNFGKELTPCENCLYSNCDAETNACIADAECLSLVQCYKACPPGDGPCYQACQDQHPDGLMKAQALGACRNTTCSGECP